MTIIDRIIPKLMIFCIDAKTKIMNPSVKISEVNSICNKRCILKSNFNSKTLSQATSLADYNLLSQTRR